MADREGLREMTAAETARQLAYVCNEADFDATLDFWVTTMNIGPWFILDVSLEGQTFRGEPTDATSLAGLAMHGGVQFELLCATNDAPSPYTEWIEYVGSVPRGGLFHHFLIDSDDYDATCERLLGDGFVEGFRARLADGRKISYLDGRDIVGSYVEIIQTTPASRQVQHAMREVSANWDGRHERRDYIEFIQQVAASA